MEATYKLYSFDVAKKTFNALELLLVLLFCVLSIYIIQYYWLRRRIYYLASKIPGPPTYPILGNALSLMGKDTKEILKYFFDMFEIYRSPFRYWLINRLYIVVTKPKDLEILMTNQNCFGKDEPSYRPLIPYVGTSLVTAPVKKWRKNRKIISPAFNKRVLETFVSRFNNHFDQLFQVMETHVGKGSFDVFKLMSRCTLNILLDAVMGVNKASSNLYFDSINRALEMISVKIYNAWLNFDFIYKFTEYPKKREEILKVFHTFTRSVIRERKLKLHRSKKNDELSFEEGEEVKRKVFLELLIELSEEEGFDFTNEELREEVDSFMVGGSDTTAGTSSFAFVMIGMHPEVQEKLYEEAINILGPDRPVEPEDLPKLKYTEMVLKETVRIFPGAPVVYRAVKEDLKLDTCILPAGSAAMIPIILAHRDPKVWKDPLKFDPERFLPEETAKRHPYSWVPFSGGPRNCIGMQFALMEMKTLIANTVRKFKIRTDYKRVEDIEIKMDVFLKTAKGHNISVELRE